MSFGDNLQFLRKRQDLTQEALAEKLEVSRQSVSKWESNGAYPEMGTILQLCDMFSVDLDTLLRGDVQAALSEDTAGYDRFMTRFAFRVAGAVAAILAGVALLCVLNAAVVVLVASSIQYDYFTKKHPVVTDFYTYEEKEAFRGKFIWLIAGGVGAILLAVALLLLFFAVFPEREPYGSMAAAVLLLVVAGAVFCFVLGEAAGQHHQGALGRRHGGGHGALYRHGVFLPAVAACRGDLSGGGAAVRGGDDLPPSERGGVILFLERKSIKRTLLSLSKRCGPNDPRTVTKHTANGRIVWHCTFFLQTVNFSLPTAKKGI